MPPWARSQWRASARGNDAASRRSIDRQLGLAHDPTPFLVLVAYEGGELYGLRRSRFAAVSGLKLLAPGDLGQLNDPGPSAARTALAYARDRDEMYVFQGGSYTPDQIQDLFRGLGSDTAILLDGGGSSAIVLRRDTGGMWAGAGVPKGSCDTMQVLCDSRERALPAWLGFN